MATINTTILITAHLVARIITAITATEEVRVTRASSEVATIKLEQDTIVIPQNILNRRRVYLQKVHLFDEVR